MSTSDKSNRNKRNRSGNGEQGIAHVLFGLGGRDN
jgi:hypothetical protein